jgi:tetratricopeptide (TPR) repeat protein
MTGRSMRAGLWIMLIILRAATTADAQSEDDLSGLDQTTLQLLQMSKQPGAIAMATRDLAAAERQFGPDAPNVGQSLDNLARLYQYEGKYDQAEPLYKRALVISEKVPAPDHADTAFALDSLATLYRIQHRYAEAEVLLKRSLTIQENGSRPDHLNVYLSVERLAVLYQNQRRYADAEPYLKRALVIREKAFGPDHPKVGQSLHEVARLYRMQGHTREAGPNFNRAVMILGSGHPEAILAAINAGEYDQAARAIGRQDLAGKDRETIARGVRQTFFGQVTDLYWTGSSGNERTIMIEGEATHGNQLWQPFAVFMKREGAEWTLRSIHTLGLAWK